MLREKKMKQADQKNILSFNEKNSYNAILLIAVFFIPISFLFFFHNAFFNGFGWIDPFIYVGYGYNYDDASYLTGYYKISRLPYVLTQYFFRSIFNPEIVNYILHFTIYVAAAYLIFKLSIKATSNIISTFLVTISAPLFLVLYNGGADYHNSFSAVLFLLTTLYIVSNTLENKDNSKSFPVYFGILYALVIHSNILLSFDLLLYCISFYISIKISRHEKIFSNITQKIFLMIAGFLLCTLALCIINSIAGRHFMFMKPLWSFMISGGDNFNYWKPLDNFIWTSKHLANFFALFIFSCFIIFYLVIKKTYKKNIFVFTLNIAFILVFLELMATQLAGMNNIDQAYFAFTALLPFMITLCVNLSFIANSDKIEINSKVLLPMAIFFTVFLLTLLLNINELLHNNLLHFLHQQPFISHILLWLTLFGLLFILKNRFNKISIFVFLILYSLVLATATKTNYSFNTNGKICNNNKSTSDYYVNLNNHLKQYKLNFRRQSISNIFIWSNPKQNLIRNPECVLNKHYDIKDTFNELNKSLFAAAPGSINSIDNLWQEGGINDIDNLWKTQTGEDYSMKEAFLNYSNNQRVLALVTYDENDVTKMIKKMKSYGINFTISEKRKIFTDAFMIQYYVLAESELANK